MMQMEWHIPSRHLTSLHLEEAMERSRIGLPGLLFSVAVATLAGIVTPAPAREAPPLMHHQPDGQCAIAEIACGYSVETSKTAPRPPAAIAPPP